MLITLFCLVLEEELELLVWYDEFKEFFDFILMVVNNFSETKYFCSIEDLFSI